MISIKTNIKVVVANLNRKLAGLSDPEFMRPVALAMIPEIARRIHVDGKDSAGNQIGEYSTPYLKYVRPKHNQPNDKKVIISLTRQLENDYAVVATGKGYGIGFNNPLNYDKSQWVQLAYKKKIFNLTAEEKKLATDIVAELASKTIAK